MADGFFPNVEEVISSLRATTQAIERSAAQALYIEGNDIMTDSKANFVPVDIGTLRGSGFVENPVIDSGRIVVEIGYGGPAESYALEQHERIDYHHKVGQAKYLETPMNQAAKGLDDRLAARIQALH